MTPSGMPTSTETSMAARVSSMVAGSRCARSSAIGRRVKRLVPMSPRRAARRSRRTARAAAGRSRAAAQRLDLRRRRRLAGHQRHRIGRNDPRDDERDDEQPSSVGTNQTSAEQASASILMAIRPSSWRRERRLCQDRTSSGLPRVVYPAHLLPVADRAEADALEVLGPGTEVLRVVDPHARPRRRPRCARRPGRPSRAPCGRSTCSATSRSSSTFGFL